MIFLFDDARSYSFANLQIAFARKDGESDAAQAKTIRDWLKKHGIHGIKMPNRGRAFSGRILNAAIARGDQWENDDEL